jgi:hypothetical protein
VRPKGRQAGLHKGDRADACSGSDLAGRPEASNGPPALPEADNSANDGARASAQPSSLSQVSPLAAPIMSFDAQEHHEHQLNQPLVLNSIQFLLFFTLDRNIYISPWKMSVFCFSLLL